MRFAESLRAWARKLKRDGVTLWFACKHPRTPWYAKALGMFVVAYALSPIDLIPDFIPVLGYLDDLLLLPGLVWLAISLTPPEVIADCRRQGDAWLADEGARPRSLWGAAFVVAVWICAAWGLWALFA
jgi:uncharacterized membrane protein YkvA (DUF1232 family)